MTTDKRDLSGQDEYRTAYERGRTGWGWLPFIFAALLGGAMVGLAIGRGFM